LHAAVAAAVSDRFSVLAPSKAVKTAGCTTGWH